MTSAWAGTSGGSTVHQSFPEEGLDSRGRVANEGVFRIYPRFFNEAWCESRCIGPATLVLQSASYVARSALKTEMRSRQAKASRTPKPPTRVGWLRVVEGLDDGCHGFDTGCCLVREVAANLVESGALKSEERVGEFVDASGQWLTHLRSWRQSGRCH